MAIPHGVVMRSDLTLKGKWMDEREDIKVVIEMVEAELLKLGMAGGVGVFGEFALEKWDDAFTAAEKGVG